LFEGAVGSETISCSRRIGIRAFVHLGRIGSRRILLRESGDGDEKANIDITLPSSRWRDALCSAKVPFHPRRLST
jgi:hypothetical protein